MSSVDEMAFVLVQLVGGKGFMKISPEDEDWARAYSWSLRSGYAACRISIHRLILQATKGFEVDHINGDPLDNRRSNLRIVTHKQNMQNQPQHRVNSMICDSSDFVLVPLSGGMAFAKVSPEDEDRVKGYNWNVDKGYVSCIGFFHKVLLQVPVGFEVDHINGDPLDNRRSNLRAVTHQQNGQNQSPQRGRRVKGVHYREKYSRWQAYITIEGRKTHIGFYGTEELAARAYDSAALHYYGQFARPNYPGGVPLSIEELQIRNQRQTSSRYWGVSWSKEKERWTVKIKKERVHHIGRFDTEEAAAMAYDRAALLLHGKEAVLNYPEHEYSDIEIRDSLPVKVPKTSKYRGVSFKVKNRKWQAKIKRGDRKQYIGIFVTQEEAARAYDRVAFELDGVRAKLNFPEELG